MQKGYNIVIIDNPELSACSKVGGGGINPVVFKRYTKSWMADEILPVMKGFYEWCEKEFHCDLIFEKPMVKLFTEQQEADLWLKKANSDMKEYLSQTIYHESTFNGIHVTPAGYSIVKHTAAFAMPAFLEGSKKWIKDRATVLNESFDYDQLNQNDDGVVYKGYHAQKVIFAQGYLVKDNPWFSYIPFKPVKGEILTFTSNDLDIGNNIIKKSNFIAHLYGNVFKTGATYNWDSLNDVPTKEGRQELELKLKKIITTDYAIINHEAGVRPAGTDRRPIIGPHPKNQRLLIFNGLGAKGVMLCPYFADHFISHLNEGNPLNKEVDVARFNHFFVN